MSLNFINIFYCKKLGDTLILYTTSHNMSFWNPWELVHVNRSENLAKSVNLEFLEVSAPLTYNQNVIWKLEGRSWLILILIDMFLFQKIQWHLNRLQDFAKSVNFKFRAVGNMKILT